MNGLTAISTEDGMFDDMCNSVALVNVDGTICDGSARFAMAETAKQGYLQNHPGNMREAQRIYWDTALDGDKCDMDTIIEGVHGQLAELEEQGYRIVYHTSRPEWRMRGGTLRWLYQNNLLLPGRFLSMKPEREQFTKSYRWKIDELERIAGFMLAKEVLFVEAEQVITEELLSRNEPFLVRACTSLEAAYQRRFITMPEHPF